MEYCNEVEKITHTILVYGKRGGGGGGGGKKICTDPPPPPPPPPSSNIVEFKMGIKNLFSKLKSDFKEKRYDGLKKGA